MEITKSDINKYFYFLDIIDGRYVLQYGKLISILPKYMFLDKFSSKYSREQTYLFEVVEMNKSNAKISVSDSNSIFEDFDSFQSKINNALFGYSVLLKERERSDIDEFEI